MSILEAIREALQLLNHVEIKGEPSIAAMSRAMSLLKGIETAIAELMEAKSNDSDDQQGQDV